ncbi:hypothetical protein [uncultured Phenylobacterium sp.]|uniref:hypothetical protein n=1 Tax=uncultured Phenylobacterium sp. TaxID=349273 RepID=UPI0025E568FB|nr:hypothetical protein [uncultured Phenylobacterium sp.]
MSKIIKSAPAWIAAALLCAPGAASAAENFTFESTLKLIDSVRVPATGSPFEGARVFSISNTTTFADGRKGTTTGKCSTWTAPAGSMFTATGVCALAPNDYTARFNCSPAANTDGESDCWGLLEVVSGPAKGRTGVIAFRRSSDSTRFVGVGTQN